MRYHKLDGATLVNNFTLHHASAKSDGRPFVSTCVPQTVHLDLHDIEIAHAVEWQDKDFVEKTPETPNFKLSTTLNARGTTIDTITVFRVPEGQVGQFKEIEIQIKPLRKGIVGGKAQASSMDGVKFSGMSSTTVPEEGLMDGEPGKIFYRDPQGDWWDKKSEPYLQLEAYIDEAEFNSLLQRLSVTAAPIATGKLQLTAELFENEVDATLSEPWHPKQYGLLMKSEKTYSVWTRARADRIQIDYRPVSVPPPPEATIDEDGAYQPATPFEPVSAATVKKIEKHLKNIAITVGIGLAAIFFVLISR
ncbi:hypothetical protein C3Y94_028030 [Rhizobium ruizarguesonis]|uniref:hypothetical protein n=1 Tax=Rhizobium ruizarguesonis TaxID=2081791 RepID=UPI00163A0DD4|nr:hypothetical protein [Rhizobium ruizarguesonis]MBC2806983.1 hypothetical protein [Rhizobium ruizarguesonis]